MVLFYFTSYVGLTSGNSYLRPPHDGQLCAVILLSEEKFPGFGEPIDNEHTDCGIVEAYDSPER